MFNHNFELWETYFCKNLTRCRLQSRRLQRDSSKEVHSHQALDGGTENVANIPVFSGLCTCIVIIKQPSRLFSSPYLQVLLVKYICVC